MCSSKCECSVCGPSFVQVCLSIVVLWSLMRFAMSSFSCFRFCVLLSRLDDIVVISGEVGC